MIIASHVVTGSKMKIVSIQGKNTLLIIDTTIIIKKPATALAITI